MKNQDKNSQIDLPKLQEIGTCLYQIREEKKISLDMVAAKTLIPKRLLIAIEQADISKLPEPFYIKALIVKFARAIDAELPDFTLTSAAKTSNLAKLERANADKRNWSTPSFINEFPRKLSIDFQVRSLHLYLFYILLVGFSVKGIAALVERPLVIEQAPEQNLPKDASVVDTDPTRGKQTVTPQLISQTSQSQSVTVGIDLEDRCWLKVMVDGKKAFEGTLPKGTKRTWTGKKQVTIRAGNAGGVAVTFNNERQQILGEPGEVQEVTYTVN
ncbi:RodZ domain-containing protein [Myxosarcina sp. GI1]|uniref:helix-turn-helix domain-containing protein n=1 Tax=Myxosarcina sp. GI1 TaxID=1541065 RepID=UPI00068C1CBB|nr:RodZ domain-containing protein [Myxosarcina sp. GI1]